MGCCKCKRSPGRPIAKHNQYFGPVNGELYRSAAGCSAHKPLDTCMYSDSKGLQHGAEAGSVSTWRGHTVDAVLRDAAEVDVGSFETTNAIDDDLESFYTALSNFEDVRYDSDDVEKGSGQEHSHVSNVVAGRAYMRHGIPSKRDLIEQALRTRAGFQPKGFTPLQWSKEIADCGDRMKQFSYPLFAFSRMLGKEQRHALWILWNVCHALECSVTLAELHEKQETIQMVFDPKVRVEDIHGTIWVAMRSTLCRFSLIPAPFQDLAAGLIGRTGAVSFESMDDFLLHCYRFGGAIGLVALPVLIDDGMFDGDVAIGALALGLALKMTDMLNCVGHHFTTLGNRTIPKELLQRFGIDESELESNLEGKSTSLVGDARWQSLMRQLVSQVRPLLLQATWAGEQLPRKARVAVHIAVRMCLRVIVNIETRGYNNLNQWTKMFTMKTISDAASVAMWTPRFDRECLGST